MRLYYVSEGHSLNSSSYQADPWSPDIQSGSLSLGNFSTAVNTRSLSVAATGIDYPGDLAGPPITTDRGLLLYEDPTGRVSALCKVVGKVGAGQYDTIDSWVDITSQESKSLLGQFRNTPNSTAERYSKTLFDSSFEECTTNVSTLSAPFTCVFRNPIPTSDSNSTLPSEIESLFYLSDASNSNFLWTEYFHQQ